MIKRYNFFLLLLALFTNFHILTKHVELHTIPVLYSNTTIFGIYNNTIILTEYCRTVYNCFRDLCNMLINYKLDYVGLKYDSIPHLCDDNVIDLLIANVNVVVKIIAILLLILFICLINIVIIVIIALLQPYNVDRLYSSLRYTTRKHWAHKPINIILYISHAISFTISILIILNTYNNLLPHMFYSTLLVESVMIILQVIHIYDSRKLNYISDV